MMASASLTNAELAVEALLVASPRPITVAEIQSALPGVPIQDILKRLSSFWSERGMRIECVDGSVRLAMPPDLSRILSATKDADVRKSSDALMETLAVIAVHQPVTLQDIERIRGVRLSRGILDALLDEGMIRVSRRRSDAGRAATYVTTEAFLERYGLDSLHDLPTPEEIAELINPPTDSSGE